MYVVFNFEKDTYDSEFMNVILPDSFSVYTSSNTPIEEFGEDSISYLFSIGVDVDIIANDAHERKSQEINENFLNFFRKDKKLKLTPNIWTHSTHSEDLIKHLKSGGDFISKKEDLSKFNVPDKGKFATYVNQFSPNFKKGSIFSGFETHPFLITTELPDDAFQPNWNSKNYDNLIDSQNVGVLKPEYRKSKHFKLWRKNKNGDYILIENRKTINESKKGHYVDFNNMIGEDISLEVWDNGEYLELQSIVVPKSERKQGIGTKIMNLLTDYADETGKDMYLTPDVGLGASSFNRLVKFYKRFGFEKNRDFSKSHYMVYHAR